MRRVLPYMPAFWVAPEGRWRVRSETLSYLFIESRISRLPSVPTALHDFMFSSM